MDTVEILSANFAYCTKGLPRNFNPENYRLYSFSKEQFQTACFVLSGNCTNLSEDPLGFILQREEELIKEHNEGYAYCEFGFAVDNSIIHAWYETTSGTILSHSFTDDEDLYECYLPNTRLSGYHNTLLDMIQEGMTLDQFNDWYNCECFREKHANYNNKMVFWNTKMVPLGYPQMESYESHWEKIDARKNNDLDYGEDDDDMYDYGEDDDYVVDDDDE